MSDTPNQNQPSGSVDPVDAAERRRRIPVWAIVLFPALIVWAIIYVNGVTVPPAPANTPEAMGAKLYSQSCAGCHGANGEGGTGPAFAGGDLDKVFPKWQDQVKWVDLGSANWTKVTGSKTFGDTKKPADPAAGMPGFGPGGTDGSLGCAEIAVVVQYEREHFAGIAPEDDLTQLTTQVAAGDDSVQIPNCVS